MKKYIKDTLLDIYRLDKTPKYNYSSKERGRDNRGKRAGMGKRWLTPKEIVFMTIKDAGLNFWDEYPKRCAELALKEGPK